MNNFQWFRRMIGGKWARVSGWLFGKRWIHVSDECVERVDEDWQNIADSAWRYNLPVTESDLDDVEDK